MYFLFWLVIIFLIGTLIGHALHWVMHKRWSGKFYRIHLAHHKLYKYSNFYSIKYRNGGKNTSTLYFVTIIALFISAIILCAPIKYIPWLLFEGIIIGAAHELMHIAFHLKDSKLRKFKWFKHMEDLHKEHHRKVYYNYGIFWFGWDRIFGSYKDTA